jgi:hypothetical protein
MGGDLNMAEDRFFWFRDEEFGRQTIAGLNPCCIQLVTVYYLPMLPFFYLYKIQFYLKVY